ncbi:MAG: YncE family protein [Pseudomonadota bacterium]|nr:YncE family protein [Pseudomonadota bacterium]
MTVAASIAVAVTCAAVLVAPPDCRAATGDYLLKTTHTIAGDGGWDYLTFDPSSKHLFIARATRVQVVDPETGRVVGEIADTPGVHGVALADDLGKGYTSNGRDNSVSVFDLKTLQVTAKVSTPKGENPDFIAYDAVARRVFAFNGRSANASVIDATTDRLIATIALHGKPEAAVSDGRGRLFVDIEDSHELVAIDTATAKVTAVWPLKGCDEPSGLAMDTAAHRLFVGCHNQVLAVVNADSGAVMTTLPIGAGVDATAFDASTHQVFSSQGDGTLTVIQSEGGDRFRVAQTALTQAGARTMALNPNTHEVYLVTADFETPTAAASASSGRRVMKPGTFRLLVMAGAP